MESLNLEVLPLHNYPDYLKPCCDLINDEWKRSETARMMFLQASCDDLPTSLILVSNKKTVLGHCKLTPIPSLPHSCFIETVVISRAMRGKKLGTFLMKQVEEYCRNVLKSKMLHLSTKGQEIFYAKLGYEICAPVSIYGSNIHNIPNITSCKNEIIVPEIDSIKNITIVPIPPPPPPIPDSVSRINTLKSNKTFMFKYL